MQTISAVAGSPQAMAGCLLRHLLAERRQLPGPVVALRMDHDARSATARRAAFSRAIGSSARP